MYITTILLVAVSLQALNVPVSTQQSPTTSTSDKELGIQFFRQENLKAAVEALRRAVKQNKKDADAWYYLGAALNRKDDLKGARKAFKKAIELRPDHAPSRVGLAYVLLVDNKLEEASREVRHAVLIDPWNAEGHYVIGRIHRRRGELDLALEEAETASKLDPNYAPTYLLKSRTILEIYARESYINVEKGTVAPPPSLEVMKSRDTARLKRFIDARDSLEKYLQLTNITEGVDEWREQLKSLIAYVEISEKVGDRSSIWKPSEVDQKARIISKPSPSYPINDRDAGISGTVTLFLTLAFDGEIKNVLIIHAPTEGLAAAAVQAARRIKFSPGVKNGMPVSTYVRIEYNFNIY